MKPTPFAYARASTVEDALRLLSEGGEDAKLLAGGQSLMPLMAFRLARPSHLIDINDVPGLGSMTVGDDGVLSIGALVRHHELETSTLLTSGPWTALSEAASQIGHLPIRVRGTIGGSCAHADPSAEIPVVLLALDAQLVVAARDSRRNISAADFFLGPLTTALEPDEMVTEVRIPPGHPGASSAFEEFSLRAGDFAVASAAVGLTIETDRSASHIRISLGGVGPVPQRATQAEAALDSSHLTDADIETAALAAALSIDPPADAQASAEFRRELIAVLIFRAVRRLRERL